MFVSQLIFTEYHVKYSLWFNMLLIITPKLLPVNVGDCYPLLRIGGVVLLGLFVADAAL